MTIDVSSTICLNFLWSLLNTLLPSTVQYTIRDFGQEKLICWKHSSLRNSCWLRMKNNFISIPFTLPSATRLLSPHSQYSKNWSLSKPASFITEAKTQGMPRAFTVYIQYITARLIPIKVSWDKMDFSYLIGTKNMGSAGATFQYLVFRSEQVHLSPFYIVTYVQ